MALSSAIALLSACGSDSRTLSRQQFVDQVNGICQAAKANVDTVDVPADATGRIAFAETLHSSFSTALGGLYRIVPPQRVAADFDDFTTLISKQFALIGRMVQGTQNGDEEDLAETAARAINLSVSADSLALASGVVACRGLGDYYATVAARVG